MPDGQTTGGTPPPTIAGPLFLLGAVLTMGAGWPASRHAVDAGASPLWLALGRTALSALVTGAVLLPRGRPRPPGRRDLPAVLATGLLQMAAFLLLSHAALAWMPAGRTALLSNATTLWVVPLSVFLLRERIPPRRWWAVLLGLGGIAVLIGPWGTDWSSPAMLAGTALLLAAALAWALAIVVLRRWPPRRPPLELLPWSFGLAALAMLPPVLPQDAGHWNGTSVVCLLALGAVGGPLGAWCAMQVQLRLPAVVASTGLLLAPVVGIALSALWLREPLAADLLAGAVLILGGAAIATATASR